MDSLPRMKNFPLLPVPSHIPCATNATSLNNSITANNTKPCLSSSHSSSTAATTCTAATTATTNHNKSQQIMYGDGDGLMMLGENEVEGETGSGVRIRFRGGRSRRSHTSGGNGSSSHRRPKVHFFLENCFEANKKVVSREAIQEKQQNRNEIAFAIAKNVSEDESADISKRSKKMKYL